MDRPQRLLTTPILWQRTSGLPSQLTATVEGVELRLEFGDWPDTEIGATVYVSGKPVLQLQRWPECWIAPPL